uniref:Uncharacterized protein n=1 Tax=viral metagenome TaxID=1070528 RepID=A0A6C0J2B4_9ZZZZ
MSQLLFTHHDNYNLHKILGFLCLFHYFIRFYWLIMYGTMYLQYNSIYTWATPICHLFLSLSSFIFHVPKTRFDSKIIIWKELQLHNIIFTSRSAILMLYWLIFNITDNNKYYNLHIIARLIIVIAHHYVADIITNKYSINYKTTTRDINWENISDIAKKYMKKYYAICQILAINTLLLSESDETGTVFLDSAFLIMFPIQLSAFLMTLVRKNIISNILWHVFYSISLSTPYFITLNNANVINYTKIILSILFIILRLKFNINKYLLMISTVFIYLYTVNKNYYNLLLN